MAQHVSSMGVQSADVPLDTTVAIDAPEQIMFRFRIAGPAQRAIALVLDYLVAGVMLLGATVLIGLLVAPFEELLSYGEAIARAGRGAVLLLLFAAQWGYFALFEGLGRGQSPGKRWMGLRVVKSGGEPIGIVDAVLRNLLRAADWLPFAYITGGLVSLVDPQFRRLGDLVAGTMVVIEERANVAMPLRIVPPTADEARTLPARVVLDADELRTIEMFLRRAPKLGAALARELALPIAPVLGRRHGVHHADPVRLLALLYVRATVPFAAPDVTAPESGA